MPNMAGFIDFGKYDGLGLAELVRNKQVTALELVDEVIRRVEHVNGQLNAVVTRMDREARDAAQGQLEGPFAGVPFFIKDLVQPVAGVRYTRGSRYFANEIADHDSELVRRYRKAGLVLVGKTNTPEFGITPYTESELLGPAKNPWSTAHNTGGSSGGAGAVVGSRIAPMAHGGDGGGSIRIPASCCGVFGLKPTRARTPVGPDSTEGWFGFALDHALTLTVRDSAALLDAMHGHEVGAPYAAPTPKGPFFQEVGRDPGKLRIALVKSPLLPSSPHRDVLEAADDTARLCTSLGHAVEEVRLPVDPDQFAVDFVTIVAVSTAADLDEFPSTYGRPLKRKDFETSTWITAMLGRTMASDRLELARRRLQRMARDLQVFLDKYDAMLSPTLGLPPPRIGQLQPPTIELRAQELIAAAKLSPVLRLPGLVSAIAKKIYAFIPYTPLANVTGQPSMSVPLYWNTEGLPVGTMFTGRFGDEATLFRLAAQLEAARPWRDRRPGVHADRA
jgi:amidase